MSWFARIEEACAGFIERAFANMFPSDVEPAQIARKLVSTMEAKTQSENGRMRAPHRYAVYVHPSDYQRLQPHRAYLEEEWAGLLAEVAQRVGIAFDGTPSVELREADRSVIGAIEIETLESAAATAASFVLRVTSGMPAGTSFTVIQHARVGRSTECEVFLLDPSVSRSHATLDVQGDHLVVRDAGSKNGTFVNGERVQLRAVRPGDRIAFGRTEMTLESGEAP